VLPLGGQASSGMLEIERAQRLLAAFERRADIVLLSASPIVRSPAGLVWGGVAAGTVIVVGDTSPRECVAEAASSLELVGAHVLGAVAGRRGPGRLRLRRHARRNEKQAPIEAA
jgi:hypothetical protein